MKTQRFKRTAHIVLAVVVLGSAVLPLVVSRYAKAAAFQSAMVRMDRLTATTATGGRVCAKPATAGTEGKIIVRFPTTAATDYVVNGTAANWTTNATFESGFTFDGGAVTAMPITGNVASAVSGKDVTFTLSSDLTVGTAYCFNFSATTTLTTSSAGAAPSVFGYIETQTAANAQIDKSFWGATIISGDTVTVSAIVAPFFTMALSGTTDTFATNLSSTGVNTSNGNRTITVDTNALNGWILWARGTNLKTVSDTGSGNSHGALTSVTAGGYAISNNTVNALATPNAAHAFTAGTEDYGLAVTINADGAGGGTVSLNAAYNGTAANTAGVIDPTQYRPIASADGTAVTDIVNIRMLATISNATPPGADYTDTLRYVGAGQF